MSGDLHSTKNLSVKFDSPNCSFETKEHSNNRLSGRYVTNRADLTWNYDRKEYINFSVAKFEVCHKSEKVNSSTSETIGVSGVADKYRRNDSVSRREINSYNSTMSGGLLSPKSLSVKFDKVNWPTFVNVPSYVTMENSILFPPIGANIKSEKPWELPGVYFFWELSQTKTTLVDRE